MHGFLEDVISLIEMVFVLYIATSKRKSTCKMDDNTLNWIAEYQAPSGTMQSNFLV